MQAFSRKRFSRPGIVVAILFIIGLMIGNFALFYHNRSSLLKSQRVKGQVDEVVKRFEGLWGLVQIGDLGIRGYLLIKDAKMKVPLNEALRDYPRKFDELEQLLTEQGFDVARMATYKKQYVSKMNETIVLERLRSEDRLEEALAILKKDSGYELWRVFAPFQKQLAAFEEGLRDQAERDYQASLRNTLALQIILLLVSVPVLMVVIHRLRQSEKRRRDLFAQLNHSSQRYVFHPEAESGPGLNEQKIIAELIANLQKAADFIQNITRGNYEVQWLGLNAANQSLNTATLAGELVGMREQMKKVKEEDGRRLWANEGLARFSDRLRTQQEDLGEQLSGFLAELIKYVQANQGAVFVVKEEPGGERVLEMRACYAYGRKKFVSRTVYPGEGLVGQAYREKDVIFLTDVPEDYLQITSGLGQARPNSVLIVPLVHGEGVVGVLELASFQVFQEYEVDFIRKLLEGLASALVTAGVNEQTRSLLAESRQQGEVMRAQEEELRQNTEELFASQEAMSARNQVLERRSKELLTSQEAMSARNQVLERRIAELER
ncbi:MAG: GAF domain-containing protein [Ferruginibacter sp.]|nr:GAF domain-containing protein [Cytophagales bacterium]